MLQCLILDIGDFVPVQINLQDKFLEVRLPKEYVRL